MEPSGHQTSIRIDEAARDATLDDVPVIAALAEAAIAELSDQRGGSVWSRSEARTTPVAPGIEAAIANEGSLVAAGTIDGVVVGYAVVVLEEMNDGSLIARLSDIYVLPEARGVGVGEALIDRVLAWSELHGAVGLDSLALPGDRHTKNFFETFGMVARSIVVHRPLETGT